MANFTLKDSIFPAGTSVNAYARSKFPAVPPIPQGPPSGLTADATATVASDQSLAFTGLTDATNYVAYANVSGLDTYVEFRVDLSLGFGASLRFGSFADGQVAQWSASANKFIGAAGLVKGAGAGQYQTLRSSATACAAAGTTDITITWPTAFADANYTVALALTRTSGTSNQCSAFVTSKTASAITVRVNNADGTNAATMVVEATAVHD